MSSPQGSLTQLTKRQEAINLARRISFQDFYPEDNKDVKVTHDFCAQMGSKLHHLYMLPQECYQYQDVVNDLKARDEKQSLSQ